MEHGSESIETRSGARNQEWDKRRGGLGTTCQNEIQRPWCVGDELGCVTSGNRAQEPSGTVEREGDEEGDIYGSGAFSFSGLVGPEPVAEADAGEGAAFSPAATLVGVAAPLRAFAAARACACIWWCLDLPDAASATILRGKRET